MIKYYAVKDESPEGFKIVAAADGIPPRDVIEEIEKDETDSPEEKQWLIKVANPNPSPENPNPEVVVVDRDLKRSILKARRDAEKAERDAALAERDAERQATQDLRGFFTNFDKNEVVTRDDIQDALDSIVKAIRLTNKNLKGE